MSDVPKKQLELQGQLRSVYLHEGGTTIALERVNGETTRVTGLSRADVGGMCIGEVYRVFIEQVTR